MNTYANCDCVGKLNNQIIEATNSKEALFEASAIIIASGRMVRHLVIPFQRTKTGKILPHGIIPSFCPFCGVKYKDESEPEAAATPDAENVA